MKKLVIVILVSLFILTACGKKEEEKPINNNEIQKQEEIISNESVIGQNETNETQPINNGNEYVIDDEILDIDEEDNAPLNEGPIVVEQVINCDGCVYAYFSDEGDKAKTLGSTLSNEEYTTDINNLKTSGGKQRHNFFGLVLSGNTITRAYACILKNNKIYCIEGSTNGAYHNSNIAILNQIFTGDQCKTLSDGHNYWCTDGSYNGNSKTNGYTSMHYETSCTIYGSDANTGKLICH